MPAGLGFIVQAFLGMMGSQILLHVNKLKNYYFHFPRNKISLRFLPKIVVYFMLHFWHS